MTIEKIVVRSLIIPSVLTIAACSPYVYKEEVGKFQDGVEQASKMLDSQKEFLSKRGLEINRSDLLDANSPRLVISEGCADAVFCLEAIAYSTRFGKTCSGQFSASAASDTDASDYKTVYKAAILACGINAKGGLAIEIPTQLPAQRKVLASLDGYAKALAGIVDAEDKKALSEAASKACSSTQSLYSTVSNIAVGSEELSKEDKKKHEEELAKDGKAVTAVCGLVTKIGTAILDQRRLEVLSRVVKESNTKIELLANYLAEEARKVNTIVLRNELEKLSVSVGETAELQGKKKEYLASVDSAVVEKDKFLSVLRNNPEGVFLSMAEAHKKLKEALDDPKTQLQSAIAAIENFYKAAKDAHEAVKALSEDEAQK